MAVVSSHARVLGCDCDASIFMLLFSLDLKIGNQKKKGNQPLKLFDFPVTPFYFWIWFRLHLKKLFAVKHRWEGMVLKMLLAWPLTIWFLKQAVKSCDSNH